MARVGSVKESPVMGQVDFSTQTMVTLPKEQLAVRDRVTMAGNHHQTGEELWNGVILKAA